MGNGNLHEDAHTASKKTIDFSDNYFDPELASTTEGHCQVFLGVYSSAKFAAEYESDLPLIFTIIVAALFFVMACVFFLYDRLVTNRNEKVVGAAARSNALVSSLFPSNVRDRLMAEQEEEDERNQKQGGTLKGYLTGEDLARNDADSDLFKTKPIADLFPETTIMFGDIVGNLSRSGLESLLIHRAQLTNLSSLRNRIHGLE